MDDDLSRLAALGRRFLGVDLQFRRSGVNWPGPWRARLLASKNERDEYRLEAYGADASEAIRQLEQLTEPTT